MAKKGRRTIEELKAEYEKQGLTVNEVVKVVRGNRYTYARIWDRDRMQQRDIYVGPVHPKTIRGILGQKHVDAIRGQLHNAEDTGHATLAEALGKVLEAYEAEE